MARLFIAVDLSDEMREAMADVQQQMREQGIRARYEDSRNLHITLAFIGETDRTEDIGNAVADMRIKAFDISPAQIGSFPRHSVLWVGLTAKDRLKELSDSVRSKLDEIGVAYDKKDFAPHITIAKDPSDMRPDVEIEPVRMSVGQICLMETTRTPSGKIAYARRRLSAMP